MLTEKNTEIKNNLDEIIKLNEEIKNQGKDKDDKIENKFRKFTSWCLCS